MLKIAGRDHRFHKTALEGDSGLYSSIPGTTRK